MAKWIAPKATTTERMTITPDAGELIYDETLAKVFYGDGATVGGIESVGPAGVDGAQGIQGVAGDDGADGAQGVAGDDGDSAYEVAVSNGFVGTETDWLNSLVGAQGDTGPQGVAGNDGAQGIQGPAGADGSVGADGDSAYQVWIDAGNTGTQQDFLDSLVGADGAVGSQGPAGSDGAQGIQGIQGPAGNDGADGAQGPQGIQGATGATGATGPAGPGLPSGGTAGQIPSKIDSTDYNTEWVTPVTAQDAESIAAGSTLGLQQALLANAGQPALTVLVCPPTLNGKLQGVSLGAGNVVEVYATGADFNAGNVLYREFMSEGEPIVFTGLSFGAIVTATQGFYGVTELGGIGGTTSAGNQGVMPMMSFGFSFKETFLYAFRGSTGETNDRGIIFVTNGPLSNTIKLTNGSGTVTDGQENIDLDPWESTFLDTNGNQEYILSGTENMMACILSEGQGVKGTALQAGRNWDCRLVLPTASDFVGNPRSGFVSAPYDNTVFSYYDREGDEGTFTVSPGSPADADSVTGNNQGDHNPAGYTRFRVNGLGVAHSGADGQGGDAVQMAAVSTFSQVVAQPLYLSDSGNADETGVTIFSPYSGTAKVYEWNSGTNSLDLAYTLPITRNAGITITSKEDQLHPCAVSLSNTTGNTNNVTLVGALNMGLIKADVPIGVVVQSQDNSTQTVRSQNGTTATTIISQEDETAVYGWTPPELKAEITEGTDGILYKRVINAGVETWVSA